MLKIRKSFSSSFAKAAFFLIASGMLVAEDNAPFPELVADKMEALYGSKISHGTLVETRADGWSLWKVSHTSGPAPEGYDGPWSVAYLTTSIAAKGEDVIILPQDGIRQEFVDLVIKTHPQINSQKEWDEVVALYKICYGLNNKNVEIVEKSDGVFEFREEIFSVTIRGNTSGAPTVQKRQNVVTLKLNSLKELESFKRETIKVP